MTAELLEALGRVMQRATDSRHEIKALLRLSGGANMESSSFDYGGRGYVLRRAPSAAFMDGRSFGHDVEAALVRAARQGGVRAPEIIAELEPGDGLGTGYIMARVEAEVNPAAILADPPSGLIGDITRELAHIHAIKPDTNLAIPHLDTRVALAELKNRFNVAGGDRPIIALALRWCEDNLPAPADPVLVHGDFRMGNLMVGKDGLAAVLDWELAHWGDAHEDLAYGCMAVWRFGHFERPAFGLTDLESYFAAYEAASGLTVDRGRFHFWLVYRTLWWALGCLQMADIWRSGVDSSLERAVIGRRTSENELDLLLLLEGEAPEQERGRVDLKSPAPQRTSGEPSHSELLHAIRQWIEQDVKAQAAGRARFMAAVAMNAIGMLARETENPVDPHDRALAASLLSGEATLATPGLLTRLRALALRKVGNDSPKYASLRAARDRWVAQ